MYVDVTNQVTEHQLHLLLATYVKLRTNTHTVLLLVCDFSDVQVYFKVSLSAEFPLTFHWMLSFHPAY